MIEERIDLSQDNLPRKWYNILSDLPDELPPYIIEKSGKETRSLTEAFSKTASRLEFSKKRWIDIPEEVVSAYIRIGRPTPLMRASRLEKFLKTPARIYYKCEDLRPIGTFKANTAFPQAYWAMKDGNSRAVYPFSPTTRTKYLMALAAKHYGLKPTIFISRADSQEHREQYLYLRDMIQVDLETSPSSRTEVGRGILNANPDHRGSSDIVSKEAFEEATMNDDAVIILASFFNHVLMTQTVIGLEVEKQLEAIDVKPSVFIAPVGGGSNLYGFIAPFLRDLLNKKLHDVKFLAVESETSAKLTNGEYKYIPPKWMPGYLGKTYEFGWETRPPRIKATGIQTKNTAPLLSFLRHLGIVDTAVYPKDEADIIEAAQIFLRTEGFLIAPEAAYSVRASIDEAYKAKKTGEKSVIVTNISGMTYFDFREKNRYLKFIQETT
jgi:tryptophan synthase beta chain